VTCIVFVGERMEYLPNGREPRERARIREQINTYIIGLLFTSRRRVETFRLERSLNSRTGTGLRPGPHAYRQWPVKTKITTRTNNFGERTE